MSRTDRGLLLVAFILLVLTAGSFFGLDKYFDSAEREPTANSVGEIVSGEGDVRVKFTDQFKWEKGRVHQPLVFDDAIFSGENSRAQLKVGESRLDLESNTLIILRREQSYKSINLTRGMLNGVIAKDDRLRIETSGGEKFDLSADEQVKVVVERKGTRTTIRVTSGNARIVKDGKTQNLTNRDSIEFVDSKPEKNDPIQILEPVETRRYSRHSVINFRFAWTYSSKRTVKDSDEFIFESSSEPSFRRILARENLLGKMDMQMDYPIPQTIYYRVKDGRGNFSPTRKLVLERPAIPSILSPKNKSEFEIEKGDAQPVILSFTPPQVAGRLQIQAAKASDFSEPGLDLETTVPQIQHRFPPGTYWLRVRTRFDAPSEASDWSEPVTFEVRQSINPLDLQRASLQNHILIPNLEYPKTIYSASETEVGAYLATMSPFPTFFSNLQFENHTLMAMRKGKDRDEVAIDGGQFPKEWVRPGLVDIVFNKFPGKSHRLMIEMEPPNKLQRSGDGTLSWSPILFANSYEGRFRDNGGTEQDFTTRKTRMHLRVDAGHRYSYRVRALGRSGTPISGWSEEFTFEIPSPVVPVEPPIVEQTPVAEVERKPASEEKNATVSIKGESEKPSIWQRVGWWLWSGSGYNYVNVRQTISNTANVEYENTKGPSAFVEAGYMSSRRVGGVISYKRTPGDVRVDNYPINKRDFIWTTTSAEGLLVLPWHARILNFPLLWTLRAGVQNHYFPFLYVESGNKLIQGTNQMMTGSVGFITETVGDRIKYYWSMRYQQPISSSTEGGNSFSVTPKIAFDGSVGASYNLTERWKTGLFWYGQLHSYDFKYQSSTQNNQGTQSLFYSNMELRLGIDF